MPKMVVTHSVVDIERWLGGKAERSELIGKVRHRRYGLRRGRREQQRRHHGRYPRHGRPAGAHDLAFARGCRRGGAPRRDTADHRLHRKVVGRSPSDRLTAALGLYDHGAPRRQGIDGCQGWRCGVGRRSGASKMPTRRRSVVIRALVAPIHSRGGTLATTEPPRLPTSRSPPVEGRCPERDDLSPPVQDAESIAARPISGRSSAAVRSLTRAQPVAIVGDHRRAADGRHADITRTGEEGHDGTLGEQDV